MGTVLHSRGVKVAEWQEVPRLGRAGAATAGSWRPGPSTVCKSCAAPVHARVTIAPFNEPIRESQDSCNNPCDSLVQDSCHDRVRCIVTHLHVLHAIKDIIYH
jgi:hypothetical protein